MIQAAIPRVGSMITAIVIGEAIEIIPAISPVTLSLDTTFGMARVSLPKRQNAL
jgi:hypothetical protein